MILCPNCRHQELPGALFCAECGTQLVSKDPYSTQSILRTPSDYFEKSMAFDPASIDLSADEVNGPILKMRLVEANQVIKVMGREDVVVGRVVDGEAQIPDLDLADYDARALGVSRLHARIKLTQSRILLTDVGSSNGTRVNGQKITPGVEVPVNLGDVIAFGKLKVQLIYYKMP